MGSGHHWGIGELLYHVSVYFLPVLLIYFIFFLQICCVVTKIIFVCCNLFQSEQLILCNHLPIIMISCYFVLNFNDSDLLHDFDQRFSFRAPRSLHTIRYDGEDGAASCHDHTSVYCIQHL